MRKVECVNAKIFLAKRYFCKIKVATTYLSVKIGTVKIGFRKHVTWWREKYV